MTNPRIEIFREMEDEIEQLEWIINQVVHDAEINPREFAKRELAKLKATISARTT